MVIRLIVLVMSFLESISDEDEQDNWADEREYAMIADKELGLTVHPFPFNPQDILDVGGEIKPDFEELVNSCNYVMVELDPTYSHH